MKLTKKLFISVTVALVSAIFLWLAGWWLALWSLSGAMEIVLSVFVSLLLAGLLTGLVVWWLNRRKRPKKAVNEEKLRQDVFMKHQTALHFDKVWSLKKQNRRSQYTLPWYFLVSDCFDEDTALLRQMGFEQVSEETANIDSARMPITFWVSDQAIIVGIHMEFSNDERDPGLHTLIQKLNRRRPRQAGNGIIVTSRISPLLSSDALQLSRQVKEPRTLLRLLNKVFGLNLPVYVLLTEMAGVEDFCECFSTLEELSLETGFGDLAPASIKDGYQREWFNSSFMKQIRLLSGQLFNGLKSQIRANYRDSILAGPFQLEALKQPIAEYLDLLFAESQFETRPLNFRGYFFVNAGRDVAKHNLLALLQAAELGYESVQLHNRSERSRPLFSKQLMRKAILPEATLVGVNMRRNASYRMAKYAMTAGLVAIFAGFLWLLKVNFDYYQTLDHQAVEQLDRYKENVSGNPPNPDDLASSIYSLSELREVRSIYQQNMPWYVLPWLPDPSIKTEVIAAYQRELEQVLLVSMRDNLLKDMFVYNELDDKVKTLELYNLQQMLYDKGRDNADILVDYYVDSLKQEGEGDVATLERFKELAYDVLNSGAVPPPDSETLLSVVESSLSTDDLSDLLYQHVLQQGEFSRRIDMRERLGRDYTQLYKFKDGFGGYLIPYVYTREGFHELMESTAFNLANDFIGQYEGIMGRVSGRAELNRLNRQLRKRYVEAYVAYWQSFITHIELVPTNGWDSVEQQLNVAIDPVFSPLVRLYNLVAQQTDLSDIVAEHADASATTDKAVAAVAGKLPGSSSLLQQQAEIIDSVIQSIAQPFVSYHKLVQADDSGQTRLDLVRKQLDTTLTWIKQANLDDRRTFMFTALKNPDVANPVAQLATLSSSYSDPLIPDLLNQYASVINYLAVSDVRSLLNQQWHQIKIYYQQRVGKYYPLNPDTDKDVNLKDFTGLYGPEGLIATFEADYLSAFRSLRPGNRVMQSLLSGTTVNLSADFWHFIDRLKQVRGLVYSASGLGINFSLRAQALSPELTDVALRTDKPLFSYRNGPSFWSQQQWPLPDNESQNINLVLRDENKVSKQFSYQGRWNWFRMVDQMGAVMTSDGTASSLVMSSDIGNVTLLIQTSNDLNPFVKNFFTRLQLPDGL